MPQRFLDLHHVATVSEPACSPEVTFRLSPAYGLTTGHEANEWFIDMMYECEEFEVETDRVKNGARVGKHRSYERHSRKSGSGSA